MTPARVLEAGDAAIVLELDEADPRANASARAVAAAMVRASLSGVRDVVPAMRSVAVHFDPLRTDVERVRTMLESSVHLPIHEDAGRLVEVPVSYGGAHGPDLADLASRAGLSETEAASRHAAVEYRVKMLGFLPGFAYMGDVDPSIASPRRPMPRSRVPAGAVGIAGTQTGVYPFDSPGGWQVIGRTPLRVFDPSRQPPAVFAPGDRVRFVAVSVDSVEPRPESAAPAAAGESMALAATVIAPGLFTTLQDEGRWGYQHLGVPVSGAMDRASHRLANALVGNDAAAATLEATVTGPELRIEVDTEIAVAGADLQATMDGRPLAAGSAVRCTAGSTLRFGARRAGGRVYVAVAGGFDAAPVLGSRSTHVRTRTGGLSGRALRAGDRLGCPGRQLSVSVPALVAPAPGLPPDSSFAVAAALPQGGARLRVMAGPNTSFFSDAAYHRLTSARFVVAPDSDRMGYRLTGGNPIPRDTREMLSDVTFAGAIQVPPSGQPILLMADRQTTGGYPQLAVVISADLPLAGQLVPGDWVEFQLCSRAQAMAALHQSPLLS